MKWSERILKWNGWQICNDVELPSKCVICLAPHTSNWDFVWANLFGITMNTKAHFFIKKEWVRWPFRPLIEGLGGIGVDRSSAHSLTDSIAQRINEHKHFRIAITPEGTRKYNPEWKKGFYYIAQKANVPIVVAIIDYANKEMGFKKVLFPTGNYEQDLESIKEVYRDIVGKHPKKFGM